MPISEDRKKQQRRERMSGNYTIGEILAEKMIAKEGKMILHYHIKWKYFPTKDATWEPADGLAGCEAVEEWKIRQSVVGKRYSLEDKKEETGSSLCLSSSNDESDSDSEPSSFNYRLHDIPLSGEIRDESKRRRVEESFTVSSTSVLSGDDGLPGPSRPRTPPGCGEEVICTVTHRGVSDFSPECAASQRPRDKPIKEEPKPAMKWPSKIKSPKDKEKQKKQKKQKNLVKLKIVIKNSRAINSKTETETELAERQFFTPTETTLESNKETEKVPDRVVVKKAEIKILPKTPVTFLPFPGTKYSNCRRSQGGAERGKVASSSQMARSTPSAGFVTQKLSVTVDKARTKATQTIFHDPLTCLIPQNLMKYNAKIEELRNRADDAVSIGGVVPPLDASAHQTLPPDDMMVLVVFRNALGTGEEAVLFEKPVVKFVLPLLLIKFYEYYVSLSTSSEIDDPTKWGRRILTEK